MSEARDINGAVAVFKEASKNAHEKLPEQIFTDSWRAYIKGIDESFPNLKPAHIATKPHENNNRMEIITEFFFILMDHIKHLSEAGIRF